MRSMAASVMRIMSAASTPVAAFSKAAPWTVMRLIMPVYGIMVSAMKRGVAIMMVMMIKAPIIRVIVKTPIIGIVIIAM
jgi:hypothetical protein